MMESLRAHAKGWLGKVIVIGISLTFALFGLQSYTGGSGSETPLAMVGDTEIYQGDVNNEYQQRVAQLKTQFGDRYQEGMFNEQTLKNEALNRLVQEQLILQTVESEGYNASDKVVLEQIGQIEAFHKAGSFDKDLYTQLLSARGMNSASFIYNVKVGMKRDQFVRGIIDTTLVDDYQINDFVKLNNQMRDIKIMTLPVSSVIETVKVDEAAMLDYHQKNEAFFKTKEQVSIEYVELKLANLIAEVKPTEDELVAFYESEKESFSEGGERRASHILFEASDDASEDVIDAKRKLAESVLVRLEAGEDFAVLAKEFSEDVGSAGEGGDLGVIETGLLDAAFENALNTLLEGEISAVTRTPYGFHIIKLTKLKSTVVKTYEVAKADVKKAFEKQLAGEKFYQLGEQLSELSFETPESLNSLVDQLGLITKSLPAFTRNIGTEIASNKQVRDAAFSEDVLVGNNSEVIEVTPDHLVVLRVTNHKPEAIQPLEDVRAAVELSVKQSAASKLLNEKAASLIAELSSGKTLKSVAEKNKFTISDIGPVRRNDRNVPVDVLRNAFSMSHPAENTPEYKLVQLAVGDAVIIELNKVADGDIADAKESDIEAVRGLLARMQGEATLTAVLENIAVDKGVKFIPQEGK